MPMAAGCCQSSPTSCCSRRWRSCCCSDRAASSAGKAERELVPGHTCLDRARRGANRATRHRPVLDESDYPSLHLRLACTVGRSSAWARWSLLALSGVVFRSGRLHHGHPPGSLRVSNDRGGAGRTGRRNAACGPLRLRSPHARRVFHPHHHRTRIHHLGRILPLGVVHRRRQWHHQCAAADRFGCEHRLADRVLLLRPRRRNPCALGYRILVRSPFGLSLRGIKGSESRMQSLGYRTTMHLYVAFIISGAIASLAGVLYVYYNRFINPVAASFQISVEASLMAIVGGSGTIVGPFIGAGIFLGVRNWVSSFFEMHTAVMGIVFIATVLWAPGGIVGFIERWRTGARKVKGQP